jgi:hypothetical protein
MASQKNLVNRLADVGEEAIQRLGGAPGGERLVAMVNNLRERMDETQRKLRGIDELEKRLTSVEQRLDKLEGKGSSSQSRSSSSSSGSSTSSPSSPSSSSSSSSASSPSSRPKKSSDSSS